MYTYTSIVSCNCLPVRVPPSVAAVGLYTILPSVSAGPTGEAGVKAGGAVARLPTARARGTPRPGAEAQGTDMWNDGQGQGVFQVVSGLWVGWVGLGWVWSGLVWLG